MLNECGKWNPDAIEAQPPRIRTRARSHGHGLGQMSVLAEKTRAPEAPEKDDSLDLREGWALARLREVAEVNPSTSLDALSQDAPITFVPMASVLAHDESNSEHGVSSDRVCPSKAVALRRPSQMSDGMSGAGLNCLNSTVSYNTSVAFATPRRATIGLA